MTQQGSGPDIGEEVIFNHKIESIGVSVTLRGSVERKADGRGTITVVATSIFDENGQNWVPYDAERVEVHLTDIVNPVTQ